jgi:hypothetical protein
MMFGDWVILLSIMGLCFVAGNLIGYMQGSKKTAELFRSIK